MISLGTMTPWGIIVAACFSDGGAYYVRDARGAHSFVDAKQVEAAMVPTPPGTGDNV